MSSLLPRPAADSPAEMAFFLAAGRASGGLFFVYEIQRDFLSAPGEYAVLAFDEDAWLVSDSSAGDEREYGLYQERDEEGNLQLMFNWPDRCVEIICTEVNLVKREYHAASAAEVLQRWLTSGRQ